MASVLLINKLFYPVYGGVETVVAQIAEGLAKDPGYDVTILAGNEEIALTNHRYNWKGVNICKTAGFGTVYNTALSLLYPFELKRLLKTNDVLHFHVPNPLGELSLVVNSLPTNKKIVVSVHADVSQTRRKFFGPAYNFLLKKLLNRADVITTMSPQNRDGFPVLQAYRHKCRIVPNAFDARHIHNVTEADKNQFVVTHGIDRSKKIVLFVGRLSGYKGLEFLLQATARITNAQLVIVGDGEAKKELVNMAKATNQQVIFTGFINGPEMACAYRCADVFVLPSTTETYGIVQAEAMRFGIPVINTALNTGVNYVSIHKETGLTVSPANVPELQAAIETIINDEASRKQYSINALERSAMFTPELMVEAFKKIYSE